MPARIGSRLVFIQRSNTSLDGSRFQKRRPRTSVRAAGPRLQVACKPNSVEDDHSSRRRIATPLKRPTRRFPTVPANRDRDPGERAEPARIRGPGLALGFPPHLVLLRLGFSLPPSLQTARCALTAPFHPYPRWLNPRRYVLCGTGRL